MTKPARTTVRDFSGAGVITSFPTPYSYDVFNNALADNLQSHAENIAKWAAGDVVIAEDYTSLSLAITAIGASNKTLVISTSINTSNTVEPVTVPGNIELSFRRSGSISKGSATSLTINGHIVGNPMHQLFVGFAAGEIKMPYNNHPVYVEWWGASWQLADNSVPINCAISAIATGGGGSGAKEGGIVYIAFSDGAYSTTNTIYMRQGVSLEGIKAHGQARLEYDGIGVAIQFGDNSSYHASHAGLRRLWIMGKGTPTNYTGTGVKIEDDGGTNATNFFYMEDVYISRFKIGIELTSNVNFGSFRHVWLYDIRNSTTRDGIGVYLSGISSCHGHVFIGCSIQFANYWIQTAGSASYNGFTWIGGVMEDIDNPLSGNSIDFDGVGSVLIESVQFDDAGTANNAIMFRTGVWSASVKNCVFLDMHSSSCNGINMQAKAGEITGNYFLANNVDLPAGKYCIELASANGVYSVLGNNYESGINSKVNISTPPANGSIVSVPPSLNLYGNYIESKGILALNNSLWTNGQCIEMSEMTPPSTPATNQLKIYPKDNGAGKTQLVVKMPDGLETVLATQT